LTYRKTNGNSILIDDFEKGDPIMENLLAQKTAIITGASSGIGRATALTLAKAGASVVMHARRQDRLDELALEIAALGGKALVVAGDASNQSEIDLLLDSTLDWDDGGHKYDIVVLGSVAGRNVSPFSGFYGSTKFAIGAIAEGFRREVCQHGVRVSIVMPGIVLSEFQEVAGYNEENFGKGIAQFGKLLEPKAIADGIHWLLTLPPHVNVNEIMIRPTGQSYP
jgi:NADP-dependent 3-hydroxy acid dehydrogenase YdfG